MASSKQLKFRVAVVLPTMIAVIIVAVISVYFLQKNSESDNVKSRNFSLKFEPFFGNEPLQFNEFKYPESGGNGKFKIRDLQFFVSNIKLIGEEGSYIQPNSYHLVRFDHIEAYFEILMSDLDFNQYDTLELSIGVDEKANSSIQTIGDLNPNSRMAWSWEVGYKFILFEGMLASGEKIIPLVYHVGFSENRKIIQFELPKDISNKVKDTLAIKVDVEKLFSGEQPWNMQEIPSVKFHKQDAKRFSNNYANLLSILN